jgi:hypothetical protein
MADAAPSGAVFVSDVHHVYKCVKVVFREQAH